MLRRETQPVLVGSLAIGGDAPVSVQTMLKQPTRDPKELLKTIESVVEISPDALCQRDREILISIGVWDNFQRHAPARCDVVRLGIPDVESIAAFEEVARFSPLPVVADIHFDARLALLAVRAGAHKIRINPGNILDQDLLKELARECEDRKVPIRIGVNTGSLSKEIRDEFHLDLVAGAVHSAMRSAEQMASYGVTQMVISIKTSTPLETIRASEMIGRRCSYPLHLGVTEAGVGAYAILQSWVGVGILLHRGIGDTIRISLTETPVLEVACGWLLLRELAIPFSKRDSR